MITVYSQVIAPTLPQDKSIEGEAESFWEKKGEGWGWLSIITCNETFVLEHYRDVLEVTRRWFSDGGRAAHASSPLIGHLIHMCSNK